MGLQYVKTYRQIALTFIIFAGTMVNIDSAAVMQLSIEVSKF
jgi:hypothetical protein